MIPSLRIHRRFSADSSALIRLGLPKRTSLFAFASFRIDRVTDRGVLKQAMWADIVIFDPATIRDLATFEQPNQLSQGMDYVLVNGTSVVAEGSMTGALPGKVLRGPGYPRH
jgi:N-acyl-D-amino-acid deacylase